MKLATGALVTALLTACAFTAGCSPEERGTTTAQDSDLTAREGYTAIDNPRGGVYVSATVAGGRVFVGDNRATIDVFDLATMSRSLTVEGRVPADSLSASGDLVAACGDRNDQPLGWEAVYGAADRHYVITLLDARSGKRKFEIALGLQRYLESSSDGIIDLPSMSCRLDADAGTVSVSFSHPKLTDEIVTFPLPSEDARHDFREIPGAARVAVGDGAARNTIKSFSSGPNGVTYAAGGYGLRRVAPPSSAPITLRDEDREHMVGVDERGGRLFAADHGGALLVLESDGALVESVPVDDWVEGVALAPGYVVVVGRGGLLVTKDRWSSP
ncbi:MAG: hypothetical protein KIS78_21625 [Labilithrix sp.]|nr:hypothetical protein [Labilithrix sp.]